jgi:alanine racemase
MMQTQQRRSLFNTLVSTADWGGRTTRAEIHLDAIRDNVRVMRAAIAATEFLAVVKSDGYGHGAVAAGRAAIQGGATRLGVYTVDEGVSLRRAGLTAPILVFGPFTAGEALEICAYNLTPTITTIEAARTLAAAAEGQPRMVHIKLDTGLTRNGVLPEDALPLLNVVSELAGLVPEGIFTHFARSDEADKTSTETQFRRFTEAVSFLADHGHTFALHHVAASGAVHDLRHMHLDMIRSGISVYGYYPSDEVSRTIPLRPALHLVSTISRVHVAQPGTGVGYGHEFVCDRPTPIALVPIGYGDGLPRTFGRGNGRVLIGGQSVPVVARVSMDQITVDVSGLDHVHVGDEAVLIGQSEDAVQTADDLAQQTGTINYDILCGIMPRVPRIYVDGGAIISATRYYSPIPRDTGTSPEA